MDRGKPLGPLQGLSLLQGSTGGRSAPRDHNVAGSTSVLAQGEPCGVYTLSCAKGSAVFPHQGSPAPSRLCCREGAFAPSPAGLVPQRGPTPQAPCRKLLNSVLRGVELIIFQSDRDIYIPNCDTRGFYRKKQCRSSKGMQRGHCWCWTSSARPCPHMPAKMVLYHAMGSEG
ncbi:Insulin-like growth factor-binding protein 6 [Collichthys lucidus]|uniref:Insulin-like growth factor-binding protein 6 n=1 Tax=Collichthys lucidus TaxID=240159 RepID=A0A4U5UP29_COLLU|nr:Insulin-like growth factor-binding protein 6 [Collichthys lucidus]